MMSFLNKKTNALSAPPPCTGIALTGTITGAYYNNTYELSGTISISGSVTFVNCNLIMDYNAVILIPTVSDFLTLTHCTHVYSCGTNTWVGIKNNWGGSIDISDNSLIEDAGVAVENTNGSAFTIKDAVFNKNWKSIFIGSAPSVPLSYYIKNTVFTSRDMTSTLTPYSFFDSSGLLDYSQFSAYAVKTLLLPGGAGLTSASMNNLSTSVAQCGIEDDDIGKIQIGDDALYSGATYPNPMMNLFENISVGIISKRTNQYLCNNMFLNIQQDASLNKTGWGMIIMGYPNSNYSVNIGAGGGAPYQANEFKDVNIPIHVTLYNTIDIENNNIRQNSTGSGIGYQGIYVDEPDNNDAVVKVIGNLIKNCETGIQVDRITYGLDAKEIIIGENQISSGGTGSGGYCTTAIDLQDGAACTTGQDKYKVRNNYITNAYNGVIATNISNNTDGPLIIYNDPSYSGSIGIDIIAPISTPSTPDAGIKIAGCPLGRIYNNYITSTDATIVGDADDYKGIYVLSSQKSEESCNNITGVGEAISYDYNCNYSKIYNNSMSTGVNGFALRNGAILGTQGSSGNDCGLLWDIGAGAFANGQTFTDATSNPNTNSILWCESGSASTFPTLNATSWIAYTSGTGLLPNTGGNLLDCYSVTVMMHTRPGGNEQAKSLVDSAQYFAIQIGSLIHDTVPYTIFGDEQRYNSKVVAYSILDSTNGQTADTTGRLQHYYDSTNVAAIGQFRYVQKAMISQNYSIASTINNNVITSNTIEANTKQVNYYRLLKLNNPNYVYSESDSIAIYSIASQCSYQGGLIVWSARALYSEIVGHRVHLADNCFLGNNELRKPIAINHLAGNFKIYPNPSSGSIFLEYNIKNTDVADISIYEMNGRLIKTYSISSKSTIFNINENELATGIYYYKISVNENLYQTDKIVILK